MRSRWLPLLAAVAFFGACQLSLSLNVPQGKLDQIARDVASVGHPLGKFRSASLVGGSAGGCMSDGGGRYVDVDIKYVPMVGNNERTMRVRFHVKSTDPCEVTTEVLSDDGPKPVLLDNELASPAVGQMVCDVLSDKPESTP
ncbi:MAG: hypothetical protein H6739_08150 [Alphaproteobacteria bacterium]|nr:hypothetical protein [Alphaproteobacteria bacterium]